MSTVRSRCVLTVFSIIMLFFVTHDWMTIDCQLVAVLYSLQFIGFAVDITLFPFPLSTTGWRYGTIINAHSPVPQRLDVADETKGMWRLELCR